MDISTRISGGPTLRCDLCPKACIMRPGERGECRIRVNLDGEVKAVTYGLPTAIHLDPIEKKPLFHFRPGKSILSLATVGCNLHCRNCQNWSLSQADPEDVTNVRLDPDDVVALLRRKNIPMVAFTYSEPLVFFEYTLASCEAARAAGIDTVLVSAGYANPSPMHRMCKVLSAANIDLKAFSDRFYRDVCDATLKPVLQNLVIAKEEGVWLEVTNLVIPTLNDDPKMVRDMVRWMVRELGPDVPLHFSRFYPQHKLKNLPPTPSATLRQMAELAREEGLRYVYVGNVTGNPDSDTHCPSCKTSLVRRTGYVVHKDRLSGGGGKCPECSGEVAGVWR